MEILDYVVQFIKPELVILIPALYFIGVALKNSERVKDNRIPEVLSLIGIGLAGLYVGATADVSGFQPALLAAFTAIVQGVLVAAMSVYVNQLIKQRKAL